MTFSSCILFSFLISSVFQVPYAMVECVVNENYDDHSGGDLVHFLTEKVQEAYPSRSLREVQLIHKAEFREQI